MCSSFLGSIKWRAPWFGDESKRSGARLIERD
jgi:hypothetical protein